MPRLRGQTEAAGARHPRPASASRVGAIDREPDPTIPDGSVIRSDPAEGVDVAAGSQVDLVISTGPTPSPTPIADPGADADPHAGADADPESDADADAPAAVDDRATSGRHAPVLAWPAARNSRLEAHLADDGNHRPDHGRRIDL